MINSFIKNGYIILPQLINRDLIAKIKQEISFYRENNHAYNIRNLHHKISVINELTKYSLILNALREYTNYSQFKLIKAILFNKNIDHNWAVAWHQDKTIAVDKKVSIYSYKNWTKKQGIPHVQPPLNILEKITTIRIALDNTNSRNGALKIIPNSHRIGILNQSSITKIVAQKKSVLCSLNMGDILIMHPLLLHSSSKSVESKERKIIHLEYSSCKLPKGLNWYS